MVNANALPKEYDIRESTVTSVQLAKVKGVKNYVIVSNVKRTKVVDIAKKIVPKIVQLSKRTLSTKLKTVKMNT